MSTPRTFTAACFCLAIAALSGCLKPPSDSAPSQDIVFGKPLVHAGTPPDFSMGAISGTGGTNANGVASAQEMDDGSFVLALRVNIVPPPDGSFYRGWLTRPDGTDPVDLGLLENPLKDARHEIRFQTRQSLYATHTRVVISLQKKGENRLPGTPIAQGILKPAKR